jgi:hypothetical protein
VSVNNIGFHRTSHRTGIITNVIDESEDEGEVEVAREEPGEEISLEERMKGSITILRGRPKHGTPLYCGNLNLELMDCIKDMKNCFECKGIEYLRRVKTHSPSLQI